MSGEYTDVAIKAGISLVSALTGAFIAVWKWGRDSATSDQSVKDDYNAKIAELREEMRQAMAGRSQKHDASQDLLTAQFKESFDGIRRQIDEHRYHTEKEFLKKEDFKDFRDEYREDMRDLKGAIAGIARPK